MYLEMRNLFRNLVVKILSAQSRRMLKKHKPFIIAVTGNIGKTTTKDYIYSILSHKFGDKVRASLKSENSEFGVNLTILGEKNAWSSFFGWSKIIIKNFFKTRFSKVYPEILVLEVGADKPGDIKFITTIINPDIVVLTAFQRSPTHGEFFLNEDQHILEKKTLLDALRAGGKVVYNADDEVMTRLATEKAIEDRNAQLYSYGKNELANVRLSDVQNLYDVDSQVSGMRVSLDIDLGENKYGVDLNLPELVGIAHVYSLSSAVSVALLNGLEEQDNW